MYYLIEYFTNDFSEKNVNILCCTLDLKYILHLQKKYKKENFDRNYRILRDMVMEVRK